MIGYISDKRTLLAMTLKSRLFIFPSLTEGMSIMLLEVTGTGTPVLASNIEPNTDIFSEEEVLFFHTGDVNDLAEKMNWALNNPEFMKKKAALARKRALEEYSGKNMTRQYEMLYDKILKSKEV